MKSNNFNNNKLSQWNQIKKRKFSAEFKSKVVIEALIERQTIEELSRKYELHPTQISL